jgi:UDP-N-acetylglucosamine acyltransferase
LEELTLFDIPTGRDGDEVRIHPTAVVEKGAELGKGVVVGPFCVVGSKVVLEDYVRLDSHVTVSNRTRLGTKSVVYQFSTIGVYPQDLKYRGEDSELIIGPENSFRQYCNVSIGSEAGGGKTVIGRRNLFMVYSHVAHDCKVADNCIFANGVSLAGHVEVQSHAVIGGHAAVHQFCKVGYRSMTGGGSMVVQDVPPFTTVQGDRATPQGLNLVGLKRSGYTSDEIKDIKTMYRLLYNENLTVDDALVRIESELQPSDHRKLFCDFLRAAKRGVCR